MADAMAHLSPKKRENARQIRHLFGAGGGNRTRLVRLDAHGRTTILEEEARNLPVCFVGEP